MLPRPALRRVRHRRVAVPLFAVLVMLGGIVSASAQSADPVLRGHGGPVRALIATDGGNRLVSGSFDSAIIIWNTTSGAAERVLRHHDSTVNALVALADGCFASGGEDSRIAIWCGAGTAPGRVLEGHRGPVAALAAHDTSSLLASASWDRSVKLWSWPPGSSSGTPPPPNARVLAEHQGPVNGVAFAADGQSIYSASYDGEVRRTYLAPQAAPLKRQLGVAINGLALATDGRVLLATADGTLRLLDAQLRDAGQVHLPDGPLTTVAATSDGRVLATAGLRTPVTLIDYATLTPIGRILGPGLPIWALAFTDGGKRLVTGGIDRALRAWPVGTGDLGGRAISEPRDDRTAPARGEDGERGAQVFRACQACHAVTAAEGPRAGPTLAGIMGRRIGTAPGYDYSAALSGMSVVWSKETISRLFEIGPNAYTPGTKMPEQRITDPDDRRALVEWLEKVTAR